jgi:P-type E1-E2 ATPase
MRFLTKKIEEITADTLICFMFENQDNKSELFEYLDSLSKKQLSTQLHEYKIINLKLFETSDFKMQSGKGVVAKINFEEAQNEKIIFCGNEKFLEENNFSINQDVKNQIEKLRVQGKASILVATKNSTENIVLGIIALSDVLRPEVSSIISKLEKMKVKSVLLTGDNEKTANYFAKLSGLKKVFANLLPEQKVQKIIDLQNNGKIVCMIGDGVNDAPALKTASVGISMASMGSDIAVEASDIALMSDDITKIPYLKKLSVATVKTIKFSISLSMFINFLGIVLSVLGLLNPTTGALVHNAGSVFVVMFAAFLYEINFDK